MEELNESNLPLCEILPRLTNRLESSMATLDQMLAETEKLVETLQKLETEIAAFALARAAQRAQEQAAELHHLCQQNQELKAELATATRIAQERHDILQEVADVVQGPVEDQPPPADIDQGSEQMAHLREDQVRQ